MRRRLLPLALALLACSDDEVCPALGQPLLELPPPPRDTPVDCDALGWLTGIDTLEHERALVLRRAGKFESAAVLVAHPQGPIVLAGDELIAFDQAGEERWRTEPLLNRQPTANKIGVGPDGRIYMSDSFGAASYKVVMLSPDDGRQIGQFIVTDSINGNPSPLEVTDEGVWLTRETADGFSVERYDHEGTEPLAVAELNADVLDFPTDLVITPAGVPLMLAGFDSYLARIDMDAADFGWRVDLPGGSLSSDDHIALLDNQLLLAWTNGNLSVSSYAADSGTLLWQSDIAPNGGGSGPTLALGPAGQIAVVDSEAYEDGYGHQLPIVALLDGQGQLVAGQRYAVHGQASGAMFGDNGAIFVIGTAELGADADLQSEHWLLRYPAP